MGNCSASDGDVSDKNSRSPENLPCPANGIDTFFTTPKLWQPAPLPSLHFSQANEDFVHKTTPRERGASQVLAPVVDQSKEPKSVLEVLGRRSIDVGMVKQSKRDAPPMGDSAPKIVKRAKPWELLEFAATKDLLCFGGGSLLALAQGSCNPLISLLLGDGLNVAFDPFFTGSVEEELREVVYKLLGVMLLMFVTAAGWQALLLYSAERQCAQMRKEYFSALCKQDTAWFDLNDVAGLPNKMASEVMTIKESVGVKYGLILLTLGNIVSGLITGAFKQFQTFMVCFAFVPPITAIGLFLSFTVGNSAKSQQKCFAKAGSAVEEILAAIRTVCAFGGEQQACDRFEAALDEALIGGVWGGLNMGLAMGGMIGTMQMMAPATFLYGAHEILNEADADQGSMVAAFSAIYLGLGSLQTVGDPLLACLKGMLCAAAMFDTMRNVAKIEVEELDPVPPQILHSVDRIEYEQVWFCYPSRPDVMILKGVDLSIVAGDKVAFCGGSGSGKSTIIQLVLRFYDPLSGVVRINGVDLKELPVRHYRRTIGYVGQEPILFATTVMENIKGGNISFSDEECIAAARQAEAFDFLDQLPQKFHTFVGIGGGAMSGGQKQRVAIARALIKKPQVLLLDEATSALDNESEKIVQNTIDSLQKHAQEGEHKLTTLAIAHRLSTIRNSNKIVCLQLGMIVEQGDHEHLMAKQGDYYGLVKAQEGNQAPPKAAAPEPTQLHSSIKKRVSTFGSGSSASQPKEGSGFLQKAARKASQSMQNVVVQLASAEMQEEHAEMVEEMTNLGVDVKKRLTAMIDHKGVMIIAFVCSVFAGAVMPINGLVLTHMMDTMFLIDKDEMQREMHVWVSIMGFNSALAFLAELGKYSAFAYIAETLTMKLRCQLFRSIVRTEIGFFDDPKNAPAGISAMLSSMCGQVTKMIGMSLGNICHAFLSFSIGAMLAMFGSWRLNLVILGIAPFLIFAMFIVVKMTSPGEGNDPWAPTYEVATETVLNMRTVKALVSEKHSIQIFEKCVDEILWCEIKSCWKKGFAFGIGNSVIHLPQIIAFTYGAWLIDDGLESQKMFQTLYCLVFGVLSAGHAAAFAPGIVEGKLAALLAFQIIDRESKCDAMNPEGLHEDLGDGSFSLEHVMFFYPHRPGLVILKDMNLIVEHGRSVAYCGPSGCGKSTVIQLAMRFYDPSGGIVRVGGTNLKEFNVCWWRKQVGLVGQEPILFDMSIYENVRYGKPTATSLEVDAMGKKADMGFILNGQKVWSDGVGPRGSRLSGGQKQRVAIARALIRNPSFLLLDEATSALDSASEHAVQQALDRAKTGRTTMSIAHRLSTIMDCDPIFICKGGYVIEQGKHEDLIALEGLYYSLAKLAGLV